MNGHPQWLAHMQDDDAVPAFDVSGVSVVVAIVVFLGLSRHFQTLSAALEEKDVLERNGCRNTLLLHHGSQEKARLAEDNKVLRRHLVATQAQLAIASQQAGASYAELRHVRRHLRRANEQVAHSEVTTAALQTHIGRSCEEMRLFRTRLQEMKSREDLESLCGSPISHKARPREAPGKNVGKRTSIFAMFQREVEAAAREPGHLRSDPGKRDVGPISRRWQPDTASRMSMEPAQIQAADEMSRRPEQQIGWLDMTRQLQEISLESAALARRMRERTVVRVRGPLQSRSSACHEVDLDREIRAREKEDVDPYANEGRGAQSLGEAPVHGAAIPSTVSLVRPLQRNVSGDTAAKSLGAIGVERTLPASDKSATPPSASASITSWAFQTSEVSDNFTARTLIGHTSQIANKASNAPIARGESTGHFGGKNDAASEKHANADHGAQAEAALPLSIATEMEKLPVHEWRARERSKDQEALHAEMITDGEQSEYVGAARDPSVGTFVTAPGPPARSSSCSKRDVTELPSLSALSSRTYQLRHEGSVARKAKVYICHGPMSIDAGESGRSMIRAQELHPSVERSQTSVSARDMMLTLPLTAASGSSLPRMMGSMADSMELSHVCGGGLIRGSAREVTAVAPRSLRSSFGSMVGSASAQNLTHRSTHLSRAKQNLGSIQTLSPTLHRAPSASWSSPQPALWGLPSPLQLVDPRKHLLSTSGNEWPTMPSRTTFKNFQLTYGPRCEEMPFYEPTAVDSAGTKEVEGMDIVRSVCLRP